MVTLAASITPQEELDEVPIAIASKKQPRKSISMPSPIEEMDERLLVVSFDRSAQVKMNSGRIALLCGNA